MPDHADRRLHPRLRVLKNRSDRVNATAAVLSSRVASSLPLDPGSMSAAATRALSACEAFAQGALPGEDLPSVRHPPRRPKMAQAGMARHAYVNVFIEALQADPDAPSPIAAVTQAVTELVARAR